jgi:hypothetical protein
VQVQRCHPADRHHRVDQVELAVGLLGGGEDAASYK